MSHHPITGLPQLNYEPQQQQQAMLNAQAAQNYQGGQRALSGTELQLREQRHYEYLYQMQQQAWANSINWNNVVVTSGAIVPGSTFCRTDNLERIIQSMNWTCTQCGKELSLAKRARSNYARSGCVVLECSHCHFEFMVQAEVTERDLDKNAKISKVELEIAMLRSSVKSFELK